MLSGRPSGQGHAVDAQRREGEKEEDAHVEIDHHDMARERHDGKGHEDGHDDDGRGDDEYGLVGERRYPILLEEDLDHVGEHLGQAEGAYPVGSVAVLPEAEEPALEPYEAGGDRQHGDKDGGYDNEGEDDLPHGTAFSTCPKAGMVEHRDVRHAAGDGRDAGSQPGGRPRGKHVGPPADGKHGRIAVRHVRMLAMSPADMAR